MFAITLGVIVSVALSLLRESLALSPKIEEQANFGLERSRPRNTEESQSKQIVQNFPDWEGDSSACLGRVLLLAQAFKVG
jgi:hypothetical protein